MKCSKIKIRSLFGISEIELGGQNMEITGRKGAGKTSVLDAIRYALTNSSRRDLVIKDGASEGEILIETDSGLTIDRKKRSGKADTGSVRMDGTLVTRPETFLKTLFTPMQLDPVRFTNMTTGEQNRAILDLIRYDWDLETIRGWFGEIPEGVDYSQNILQVLQDIQSENGAYFKSRQDVNREIRNKQAFIADIAKDIPDGYDAERWESYDIGARYQRLVELQNENGRIERAKAFLENRDARQRGLEAERDIAVSAAKSDISGEKERLAAEIARLKAETAAAEDKLSSLDDKLRDKIAVIDAGWREKVSKLDSDMDIALQYAGREPKPTDELQYEIRLAEEMKKHLNEYRRMMQMNSELESLKERSAGYTEKIELARRLPGEILKDAALPVEGLTVENGVPLINGLPISNRSDGELLELCVDIAISKPNGLKMILIDGAEKLDDQSRERLYARCREKGLQFIATRTTNDDELMVTEL